MYTRVFYNKFNQNVIKYKIILNNELNIGVIMIKYILILFTLIIFYNGCGYKTNPIYINDNKETSKK